MLKIPKELSGAYSVKEGTRIICDKAFTCRRSLSKIVIPSSVTSIGDCAFSDCDIPDNLRLELFCRFGNRIF